MTRLLSTWMGAGWVPAPAAAPTRSLCEWAWCGACRYIGRGASDRVGVESGGGCSSGKPWLDSTHRSSSLSTSLEKPTNQPTNRMLDAGYHSAEVQYLEAQGWASLQVQWNAGDPLAALTPILASALLLASPSAPLPVAAAVNGAPAVMDCASASVWWAVRLLRLMIRLSSSATPTLRVCCYGGFGWLV